MDELYEALRAAEKRGPEGAEDVAKLSAYIQQLSAEQEQTKVVDQRDLIPKAIGAGAGAVLGPVVSAAAKSGVKQVQRGRTVPLPAMSAPHPTQVTPGASAIDESLNKGFSNAITQHTREAQISQRQKSVAEILAELKAKGVPVDPKILAEMPTQAAMPGGSILLNADTAKKIEAEEAARKAAGAALPKNATISERILAKVAPNAVSDVANFAKGVSEYKLPLLGKVGPLVGTVLGGAATAAQGVDAFNRSQQDDTTGAIISGIGAAGTGVSTLPFPPPVRAVGAGVGLSAEAINAYRDAMREGRIEHGAPEHPENVTSISDPYAAGGLVHLAEGGTPDVNFSVNNMPSMSGQPGVGYMNMPPAAMARMQLEQELANKARLRAGATGMGMALPGQQGVKLMPGNIEAGANIPVGPGSLDISGYRSINPVNMPAQRSGHMFGGNVRYTLPFAEGGDVNSIPVEGDQFDKPNFEKVFSAVAKGYTAPHSDRHFDKGQTQPALNIGDPNYLRGTKTIKVYPQYQEYNKAGFYNGWDDPNSINISSSELNPYNLPSTVGHEAQHLQSNLAYENPDKLGFIDSMRRAAALKNTDELKAQIEKNYQDYLKQWKENQNNQQNNFGWGMKTRNQLGAYAGENPGSGERYADYAGLEAQLPRGQRLVDTELGKAVFKTPEQQAYLYQTLRPMEQKMIAQPDNKSDFWDALKKFKQEYAYNTGAGKSHADSLIKSGLEAIQGKAEGGDVKKPDANEAGAFVGYPQINRNRQVGSGTGFLDALVGAPPSRNNILNPSDYSYQEGYEKGEPYGIASMALPFAGAAAKPLAREMATRAFMGESLVPKAFRGLMPEQPVAGIFRNEKGGNWAPEAMIQNQSWTPEQQLAETLGFNKNDPALENWVNTQLTRYVKNDMGTPGDPIRALADQGILHYKPRLAYFEHNNRPTNLQREAEVKRGYADTPEGESALTQLGKDWETNVDAGVTTRTVTPKFIEWNQEEFPWLKNAEGKKLHSIDDEFLYSHLGFDHIVDVLREQIAAGQLRPESLKSLSVPQAVQRTHEYNLAKEKAMQKIKLQADSEMPVHKSYPEGFKWQELKHPTDPNVTEKALKYEGDAMGHCVGGYCPDVLAGDTKIYSLRDAKGEPHVTIEVKNKAEPWMNQTHWDSNNNFHWKAKVPISPEMKAEIDAEMIKKFGNREANLKNTQSESRWDFLESELRKRLGEPEPRLSIEQIKGKQNAAPKDEYKKFVQDFVRSGNWDRVNEVHNAGLKDMAKTGNNYELTNVPEDIAKLPHTERYWAVQEAIKNKAIPQYATEEEVADAIRKYARKP